MNRCYSNSTGELLLNILGLGIMNLLQVTIFQWQRNICCNHTKSYHVDVINVGVDQLLQFSSHNLALRPDIKTSYSYSWETSIREEFLPEIFHR